MSAGPRRPVVLVCHGFAGLGERLARAGFAAVVCEPRALADLGTVLDALWRGALGIEAERYGLVGYGAGARIAVARAAADDRVRALVTWAGPPGLEDARVRVPWLVIADPPEEPVVRETVRWLATQLA